MVANSPCYIEALREQSTDYEHRVRPYTPSYACCQRGKERYADHPAPELSHQRVP